MTIAEFKKSFETFSDDDRARYIGGLVLNHFCELSKNEMQKFQSDWRLKGYSEDNELKPFSEFKKSQAEIIKKCLELEMSEIGKIVRLKYGLSPLTMDTEIVENQ